MSLMDKLPQKIYHREPHVKDIQDAIGQQVEQEQQARDDLLLQCRPSTATWGLAIYEREFGITPDINKPQDQRLSVLRAKMRGQGTTTKPMLQSMAASFSGGEVDVNERFAEYITEIKFVGTWGTPPNVNDLWDSIREILPAHLDLIFTYRYLTWRELNAQSLTFAELSAMNMQWNEFSGGAWIG
jgi:hypothetical protein